VALKDDTFSRFRRYKQQERIRSYRAIYLTKEKKFVQLADEAMEGVFQTMAAAIGSDNRAYRVMSDYDPGFSDSYLVNTSDGSRCFSTDDLARRFHIHSHPFSDGKD
jgi:hypothetical protein